MSEELHSDHKKTEGIFKSKCHHKAFKKGRKPVHVKKLLIVPNQKSHTHENNTALT